MTLEELRIAIEAYPHCLIVAMEEVTKAEQAIEKLSGQIEEEEAALSPGEDTPTPEAESETNVHETLLQLEHELGLLELHCEQIKGEIELDYRRNPPHGDKVTEATVTAFVKSHPRFVSAKEQCLKKKFEREAATLSRRAGYVARAAEHREARLKEPVTSPTLERLREKLATAEMTLAFAEMRLEEVKANIASYQLLVQLSTAGLMRDNKN